MAPLTRESSGVHYNVQYAVHLPGGEPAFMTKSIQLNTPAKLTVKIMTCLRILVDPTAQECRNVKLLIVNEHIA